MNFKIAVITVCSMTFGLCVTSAFSQTAMSVPPRNVLQGQIGLFQPVDDYDAGEFDAGFNGGISYGRYINPNFIIEGAYNYNYGERDVNSLEDNIYISGLLFTCKGIISAGSVDFYAGAGIGVYGAWLDARSSSKDYEDEKEQNKRDVDDEDESDVAFGAHVSIGGHYNITDFVYVGLEGRYRWTGDIDVNDNVDSDGYTTAYKGDLNGYSVSLAVGVKF